MQQVFQIKVIVNQVHTVTFPVKAVNREDAVQSVTALLAGNKITLVQQ